MQRQLMETKLKSLPWGNSPEAQELLQAFAKAGTEVRFIGGCVRDAVLGRPVSDFDLATPAEPLAVTELLEKAGIKAIPTGIDHGTITAVCHGVPFEITTLRHDVETFGRHARVAFTSDWKADAARRDFTINALSATPDGQVYDFFDGLSDAKAGRVRFIGKAADRITEDVLRILRFFRFLAHYGSNGIVDEEALAACKAMANKIPTLSGERVRMEIIKLLAARDPRTVWEIMIAEDIMAYVLPGAVLIEQLRVLVEVENALGLPDVWRRLACLLKDKTEAKEAVQRLRLSNEESHRLLTMFSERPPVLRADAHELKKALYHHGKEAVTDFAILEGVHAKENIRLIRSKLAEIAKTEIPVFPIKGRDLLSIGIKQGPALGRLLKQIEQWWEENDYKPGAAACVEYGKSLVS